MAKKTISFTEAEVKELELYLMKLRDKLTTPEKMVKRSDVCIELIPKAKGEEAVDAAIKIVAEISKEAKLADASEFLKRIARTESRMGEHKSTYRKGYNGGIWQIDPIGFRETKNISSRRYLKRYLKAVDKVLAKYELPTPWMEATSWEDCLMPLYSCICARLLLAVVPKALPKTLEGQAKFWKKYYNTEAGAGTPEHFIKANS